MTTIAIGIDPGLSGAIAVLPTSDTFGGIFDMPIEAKGKRGNQIDCASLLALAQKIKTRYRMQEFLVAVEQVHAMPGQGVSGMFSLGQSYGAARMFAHAITGRVELVHPTVWKKALRLTGKEKDFARTRARRLFPGAQDDLARKKDVGRADAMLIAWYASEFLL